MELNVFCYLYFGIDLEGKDYGGRGFIYFFLLSIFGLYFF